MPSDPALMEETFRRQDDATAALLAFIGTPNPLNARAYVVAQGAYAAALVRAQA